MTRCAASLLALVAGCGGGDGPVITALSFLGQPPQKPLTLELQVGFEHPAGELGLGELVLSIDEAERSRLSVGEVFMAQSPPVALDARSGSFRVQVALEPPIADGQLVLIGLYAVDRLGAESNEPTLTLRAGGAIASGGDS